MEKVDLYKVLETSKRPRKTRSDAPTDGSRASFIPMPTPATRRPKNVSRRYSAPTKSSRIPRKDENTMKVPVPSSVPNAPDSLVGPASRISRIYSAASETSGISSGEQQVPPREPRPGAKI